MSADLKLVIFDCDGTLVDSQHMIHSAMRLSFEGVGLVAPDIADVRRVVGLSLHDAMERILPDGGDAVLINQLVEGYKGAFQGLRVAGQDRNEPLYDGICDLVKSLSSTGYLLGVATGKSLRGLHKTLEMHGLQDHFITLQTADTHPSKPHPSMVYKALDEAGVDKSQAVMIGDTTFDIEMARNAGVTSIGVDWGYHDDHELMSYGAHDVAQSTDDLHRMIKDTIGEI